MASNHGQFIANPLQPVEEKDWTKVFKITARTPLHDKLKAFRAGEVDFPDRIRAGLDDVDAWNALERHGFAPRDRLYVLTPKWRRTLSAVRAKHSDHVTLNFSLIVSGGGLLARYEQIAGCRHVPGPRFFETAWLQFDRWSKEGAFLDCCLEVAKMPAKDRAEACALLEAGVSAEDLQVLLAATR